MNKITINNIAVKIARETDKDPEIIQYGIEIFANSFLGYFAIISIALVFGLFKETLAVAITSSVFRVFTGGLHAKTSTRCIIIGTIVFNLLAWVAVTISQYIVNSLWVIMLFIAVTAFGVFVWLAPVDVPEKPIHKTNQRIKLKIMALILTIIWLLSALAGLHVFPNQIIVASSLGLLWQILTLTNILKIIY